MKNSVNVLAIALILTFSLGGDLSARNRPYTPGPDIITGGSEGDDHPWGGDESNGGSGTKITSATTAAAVKPTALEPVNVLTNPIERFIYRMISRWFIVPERNSRFNEPHSKRPKHSTGVTYDIALPSRKVAH